MLLDYLVANAGQHYPTWPVPSKAGAAALFCLMHATIEGPNLFCIYCPALMYHCCNSILPLLFLEFLYVTFADDCDHQIDIFDARLNERD